MDRLDVKLVSVFLCAPAATLCLSPCPPEHADRTNGRRHGVQTLGANEAPEEDDANHIDVHGVANLPADVARLAHSVLVMVLGIEAAGRVHGAMLIERPLVGLWVNRKPWATNSSLGNIQRSNLAGNKDATM